MSGGVGPVEPGEGTRAWEAEDAPETGAPRGRSALFHGCHGCHGFHGCDGRRRRAVLGALAAALLLTAGALLWAAWPQERQQAAPQPPFPSQVVEVEYLGPLSVPPGTRPRTFALEVLLRVESGPPVTATRLAQPYAGIFLTSAPRTPFRTTAGSARKIVITMHVTDCENVPTDAGLPFLDVTLRNARAIQDHSFIPGSRYAQDLSQALQVACSNESGNHQNA
ncbi:Tat pathway signal sequence domain protein [Streptomyces phaeoluteigriseus]|uniref:Tat pathway signal sequence domain protein n=1 Tax=Streptomyces phaeoluteigriseus TaxID=114686 RepID=A0ABY4ZFK4_9ACTN|nr:Tat pathway signal sequence domain protein [Streptomyces phaeoluteigriseus]USQ87721.1 Tat pathway signal sequence domain protein [Streptomyces phaeoluteigriseus]